MPLNNLWNISIGAYTFTVDRRTLTYTLTETTTNTVWAENRSLGSVEIVERETGVATVYPFGELKLISLSEKAGAQGKRILFGLDAPGRVPVDVYLTCTEREIQLTVEASRDTRTHRLGAITLLPGLCHITSANNSYLVVPHREGRILPMTDIPEQPYAFRVWEANEGLTMPFIGAVQGASALALLTDSAYAVATLSKTIEAATIDFVYERDPERRRLDIRIVPLPQGDYIGIARAYRDKTIGDGGRVSFRRKLRERPELEAVFTADASAFVGKDGGDCATTLEGENTRWDAMEELRDTLQNLREETRPVAVVSGGDWSAPFVDFWYETLPTSPFTAGRVVPLRAVVWRDAVPTFYPITDHRSYLDALLRLAPGLPIVPPEPEDERHQTLRTLFQKTSGAFLTAHRFLTSDFRVEEAQYSNGTTVRINRNKTNAYHEKNVVIHPENWQINP